MFQKKCAALNFCKCHSAADPGNVMCSPGTDRDISEMVRKGFLWAMHQKQEPVGTYTVCWNKSTELNFCKCYSATGPGNVNYAHGTDRDTSEIIHTAFRLALHQKWEPVGTDRVLLNKSAAFNFWKCHSAAGPIHVMCSPGTDGDTSKMVCTAFL